MSAASQDPRGANAVFSESVRAVQERLGSRAQQERMAERGAWQPVITPDMAAFLAAARSFYLATCSRDLQPYVQHRGGPPGFLAVLDETTLAFADFAGNRQYITLGNLAENPRAFIFVMDYARRQRLKLWGTARVVENDAHLLARLTPSDYPARAERAILFTLTAVDRNCPQHIPRLVPLEHAAEALAVLERRVAALEAENQRLRAGAS